jgi:hypothetical protein
MATSPDKLVVLDGRVTDEKLAELLDLQAEHALLDFKRIIDLTKKSGLIELAKDVGAMQVAGGYIVGGVDGHGAPTGEMDGFDARPFDEANLVPQLLRYLPEPLTIHARVTEWKAHTTVLIYVAPHPDGYAVFKADGQYEKPGKKGELTVVFREGEIFWRDGTRSVRISQRGLKEVLDRQIAAAKVGWMEEQQELRQRDREQIEAGYAGRDLAKAPIGTVTFGLDADELLVAVLEMLRANDQLGLMYLLNDARPRAASAIQRDEIDTELAELLDKLASIAALALEFEQDDLFARIVTVLTQIYAAPLGPHDDRRFALNTQIGPNEKAPRVFLSVLERVYALGALAVRLGRWRTVRDLTLQLPDRLDDYWVNWLRHGQVMAARSQQLSRTQDGRRIEISLLTRAAQVVEAEPALRPDTSDQDEILTSLAQFDFLANLAAIGGAGETDSKVFYTNWARFRQDRIQPVADRLVSDSVVRDAIFGDRSHADLAVALHAVAQMANTEAARYDGFWGWQRTPAGDFVEKHLGPSEPT